jgi:hypothetical protein
MKRHRYQNIEKGYKMKGHKYQDFMLSPDTFNPDT